MDKQPEEVNDVMNMLGQIAPNREEQSPARDALTRFHTPTNLVTRRSNMTRKPALFGAFALVALLLFSAMPATRAMASNFLGLFRVQKFAPISVSPQQLEKLGELADSGLFPGEVTMVGEPTEPVEFATFTDAQTHLSEADSPIWVSTLYSMGEPNYVAIKGSNEGEMVINLEGARAIMEAVDADPALLPDSLDGAVIDMQINDVLVQEWDDVSFVQTLGPEIGYPEGVDPAIIGEAILQFLGMDDGEAYRLANNIDWTSTMVLPVPADLGTFSEVAIGSTTGLAIESLEGDGVTLMWQAYDMVHVLRGTGDYASADDLVELAETGSFR